MQHRKGHSTLQHPGDIYTHTHTHTHGYTTTATVTELTRACRQTHTCTQKDRHCYAFSQSGWHTLRRLFVRGQCVWVVLGIRRGITGLIVSQGCRLLPLRFPPPQMKVAAEVEDGMQVFQLLNSSKLFDLLSSNCKSQVADSPVYEPSHCISRVCSFVAWQNLRSFQQINFKELLSAQSRVEEGSLNAPQSVCSTSDTILQSSIHQHYILSYYQHSEVQ